VDFPVPLAGHKKKSKVKSYMEGGIIQDPTAEEMPGGEGTGLFRGGREIITEYQSPRIPEGPSIHKGSDRSYATF